MTAEPDDLAWRPRPPLIVSRDARLGEIPKTARQLAEFGSERGWSVRITYALGWPSLRERDEIRREEPVESVAVRLGRSMPITGTARLVAVWWDGRFHNGGSQFAPLNLRQLRELVDRYGNEGE